MKDSYLYFHKVGRLDYRTETSKQSKLQLPSSKALTQ